MAIPCALALLGAGNAVTVNSSAALGMQYLMPSALAGGKQCSQCAQQKVSMMTHLLPMLWT